MSLILDLTMSILSVVLTHSRSLFWYIAVPVIIVMVLGLT